MLIIAGKWLNTKSGLFENSSSPWHVPCRSDEQVWSRDSHRIQDLFTKHCIFIGVARIPVNHNICRIYAHFGELILGKIGLPVLLSQQRATAARHQDFLNMS